MLDISSDIPLYKQLSKILYEKIAKGEWKYNEKIPTETELCELYGISRMTVRQASSGSTSLPGNSWVRFSYWAKIVRRNGCTTSTRLPARAALHGRAW